MRQVAQLFLNTLSVSGAVGNLGYRLLHREAALDLLEEAAEAVFEAYFGQGRRRSASSRGAGLYLSSAAWPWAALGLSP
jgi:hypothetical protein